MHLFFLQNGQGSSVYVSRNTSKAIYNDNQNESFTIFIENNYFESDNFLSYSVIIKAKTAFLRNNTFNFTYSENDHGAIKILLNSNISIIDCHFYKTNSKGAIYYSPESESNEESSIFIDFCTFQDCQGTCCFFDVKSNSIENIKMSNCVFDNCQSKSGSSIALSTSTTADSITLSVLNNEFLNNGNPSEISYLIDIQTIQSKSNEPILLENNLFNSSCFAININQQNGQAIIKNCNFRNFLENYINQNTINVALNEILIQNCTFENSQYNGIVIISNTTEFNMIQCSFNFHNNVKSFDFIGGNLVVIENSTFSNCIGGVEIKQTIGNAIIKRCIFSDCYNDSSVISISNQQCQILENVVNFTSNEYGKSSPGLFILSNGNIEVLHNKFIRILRANSPLNLYSSIYIADRIIDSNNLDFIVTFNYNLIKNVGNSKNGIFIIEKHYNFNFDYNIIKDCHLTDYSTGITLFTDIFVLTNLTFINCSANCQTGGGLGLWLVFKDKTGIFILKDCHFEDNCIGDRCGGAFATGESSIENMELIADNCFFIRNHAPKYGGALSIQSTLPAVIKNCTFIGNEAEKGGGAIFIKPNKFFSQHSFLPSCTISGCKFESNKDQSNTAHSIFFSYTNECETIFDIKDCTFVDNFSPNCSQGFAVSSGAPYFSIENAAFDYNDHNQSDVGLEVKEYTENLSIKNCQFNNIVGNPSCVLASKFIEIENVSFNSLEKNDVAVQILYSGSISIDQIKIDSQYNCVFELNNLLASNLEWQVNVSNSIFNNNGVVIKYIETKDEIVHDFILLNNTAQKELLSYSSNNNTLDLSLEINNFNVQNCTCSMSDSIIRIDSITYFKITDSVFRNCSGKIFSNVNISGNVIFENTEFDKILANSINENEGNVINISSLSASIINCTFKNCGTSGYVITCISNEIMFEYINNTITFDDYTKACKGLGYYCQARVIIRNSRFHKCNNHLESNAGGGIMIEPNAEKQKSYLDFINITFDEMYGLTKRCFLITWDFTYLVTRKISVINCPLSGQTCVFRLSNKNVFLHFMFDNFLFYNNTSNAEFGGGCGFLIEVPDISSKISLVFIECNWTMNRAIYTMNKGDSSQGINDAYNGIGGALQIGFLKFNIIKSFVFFILHI